MNTRTRKQAWRNYNKARRRAVVFQCVIAMCKNERECMVDLYQYCPSGCEVDHIIPIERGGSHRFDNLQYLTRSENRRKGTR